MGNCRSSPPQKDAPVVGPSSSLPLNNQKGDNASTAALMQAFVPIITPIVRKVVSQQLFNEKMLFKDEHLMKEELDGKDLPVGPIEFYLEDITILSYETLVKDVRDMPEFEWPEKERLAELMKFVPGVGQGMVALDVAGIKVKLQLAKGIELGIPVEGPLKSKCTLEVGTGGDIEQAWCQLEIPKMRVWYVIDTEKLYVAFMARPLFHPHLHVNVDRGNGDWLNMEFTARGSSLDDIIESILCGFGPSSITEKNKKVKKESSWTGDALGRAVSNAIGLFAGVGNDRPLEVELSQIIQSSVAAALGKRPIADIKSNIKALEEELAAAENTQQTKEDVEKKEKANVVGGVEEAGDSPKVSKFSSLWCGIGV